MSFSPESSPAPTNYGPPIMGSDPEFFIMKRGADELLPAYTFLPAKDRLLDLPNTAFWDGFQAETRVSVFDGSSCSDVRVGQVRAALLQLHQQATRVGGYISTKTVVEVPESLLSAARPEHVTFGCEPSYNAYGDRGLDIADPRQVRHRFAGGHLHFGSSFLSRMPKEVCEELVRGLDQLLGVACVALARKFDDPVRRQFYGRAGEYRRPKHGLEYRVPSNFWLCAPPVAHLVFDLGRIALALAVRGGRSWFYDGPNEPIQELINSTDVDGAVKFLRARESQIKALLDNYRHPAYFATYLPTALEALYDGLEAKIETPDDIVANWQLEGQQRHGYYRWNYVPTQTKWKMREHPELGVALVSQDPYERVRGQCSAQQLALIAQLA